jgi:hypothetical protein
MMEEKLIHLLLPVGIFFLTRNYLYRQLRNVLPVVFVAILIYRFQTFDHQQSESFLELFRHQVRELVNDPRLCLLLEDFVALLAFQLIVHFINKNTSYNLKGFYDRLCTYVFSYAKEIPPVQKQILKEHEKLEKDLESVKAKSRALGEMNTVLPQKGWSRSQVLDLMTLCAKEENKVWQSGHLSGAVYHGGAEHMEFLNQCFGLYSTSNPLHADIYPSIMKFDAEIVAMTAALVNGGNESVCGATSSVSSIVDFLMEPI